jgi:hypothetical protein
MVTRRRLWLVRGGVLALVGGLLGLLAWLSDRPEMRWVAACLAASLAVIVGHNLAVERLDRRWNDRAVAAALAGRHDPPPPPPRGSIAVLGVALALALAGGVILTLGFLRWHAEPPADPDPAGGK